VDKNGKPLLSSPLLPVDLNIDSQAAALSDEDLKNEAATWKLVGSSTGGATYREYFIQAGKKHVGIAYFYLFNGSWLLVEM